VAKKIVILEDNLDRQAVMRACIADRFYTFDAHLIDNPLDTIRFLESNLAETLVISLDNDMELLPGPDGRFVDPGEGLEVARFLAAREPVCPVIVHTTNLRAAEEMKRVLAAANWQTRRVIPFDDVNWITTDWFATMRRAIVGPISRNQTGGQT
jgi:hypothetical protein